jgi:anti-sigma regulatory factor (Ser/Thr protein kinase)
VVQLRILLDLSSRQARGQGLTASRSQLSGHAGGRANSSRDAAAGMGSPSGSAMRLTHGSQVSKFSSGVRDGCASCLRESYPAVDCSVAEGRRALADFAAEAGASEEQVDAVRSVASEALTNVVRYAYPARIGHIHVTARLAGGELWVLIADNGCGLHAGSESDGLGLGLALISQLTDGFSVVERSSGGTELRMRFCLTAGCGSRDGQDRGSAAAAKRPASPRFSTTT